LECGNTERSKHQRPQFPGDHVKAGIFSKDKKYHLICRSACSDVIKLKGTLIFNENVESKFGRPGFKYVEQSQMTQPKKRFFLFTEEI
jgi:hypothetical protein